MRLVKIRSDKLFVFEREGAYFVFTRSEIMTFSFRFVGDVLKDLWNDLRKKVGR